MMIGKYDAQLDFGSCALADKSACENTLLLDAADPARMAVNIIVTTAAAGGTSVTFKVQGCDTESGTYVDVAVSPLEALAKLTKGANFSIPIPQDWNYKYMKVAVTKAGTFTAGAVQAALDVYQGV